MRGNLILIFSFIFCVNKFSAAQNCSQPPPNYNVTKVRECCKVPPIESVMYKFVHGHCKDLVETLQIAIHSKPVGNSTTSNGQGSQNTQQGQQSTQPVSQKPQSSQSALPTTLLSPITTTIAAITTILPNTIQPQQQGTSQGSQQSEPPPSPPQQPRPPQQSSNAGQQQESTQQQALGQGNTQKPHKKPPPPKMPARYTIPFMCAMECTMNQLQIVTNGKYNKENADNFLQNVLKNVDFTPVLQKVMPDCVEIASEKANKFVTTYNYTSCNTFGGHYLRCINQEAANYCPDSKLLQTPNCTNLQNYIKACGPPKN